MGSNPTVETPQAVVSTVGSDGCSKWRSQVLRLRERKRNVMQQILDEKFEFEGHSYAVRGVFTGGEIVVRAFDGRRPASPLASVSFETASDFSATHALSPVRILADW